jgi:hypothetical protein
MGDQAPSEPPGLVDHPLAAGHASHQQAIGRHRAVASKGPKPDHKGQQANAEMDGQLRPASY